MNEKPIELKSLLGGIVTRRRRILLWSSLAACWAAAAFLGLAVAFIERQSGWASSLAGPIIALLGIVAAFIVLARGKRRTPNLRGLAQEIEARHPELEGRLLTAVQQPEEPGGRTYLQERLLEETVAISQRSDWGQIVPRSRVLIAQAGHWLAVAFLAVVIWGLRVTSGPSLVARIGESGITVTPGDTSIEKGNSLVVFVKIAGQLPPSVEMIAAGPDNRPARIPLVKSLADPIFGGSITEVSSNFTYHIEHAGQRTREFKVTVFEYPRLERADMEVTFPTYTGLAVKRIENTKRLSAVEGSTVDVALQLNKPVASATLIPKDKSAGEPVRLQADTNHAVATLSRYPLEHSRTFDLQLVDAEGRTNKVPAQFVFEVLTNRAPEFRLASPKGDLRPSPLEEIAFEGTVWDDFGVKAYGLGYAIPGQDPKYLELGKEIPGKEKKTFQYTLHLEDLKLQPDQLVSWFMWADDMGPDGEMRRTAGDLYFAEIRPFDEIFREGQGMDGGQSGQQGGQQGQSRTEKLTELQKQIISATWRLRREHGGSNAPPAAIPGNSEKETIPTRQSRNEPRHDIKDALSRLFRPPIAQFSKQQVFGQTSRSGSDSDTPSATPRRARSSTPNPSSTSGTNSYADDATVVHDSQAQAIDQVEEMSSRTQDPRSAALWAAAKKQMEKALSNLEKAKQSPATLPEALAAEQAAYQELLRLQQHEYQVMRNRRNQQQGGGGGRQQEMQRQLDQLDLKSEENRYETQRQAQKQQTSERREQLQVQNRLQELARRQQDLNDRLKELQAALQEAKTEQEKEEIRRRLKRLQEEEQQMLNDVDELRQRMDRPENQSKMADERKQLEDSRKDVQQAADAASQGEASQALASGTRAQRQLQQLRDQVRKQNSNQFADDLRQMRNEARELARQQDEILKNLQADTSASDRSLAGSTNREEALNQLNQQTQRLTNLVDRATQLSQETEDAEPVVSRQLYDSVRKFAQDSTKAVQETQDELLSRGLMTREVYETLQNTTQQDGPKLLDATSQLVKQDLLTPAARAGERTRSTLSNLKQGVERAAESVLGDDTEALRLAQQEIDQVTQQLQREMRQNGMGGTNKANDQARSGGTGSQGQAGTNLTAQAGANGSETNLASTAAQPGDRTNETASARNGSRGNGQPQRNGSRGQQQGQQPSEQANNAPPSDANAQQGNPQEANGRQGGGANPAGGDRRGGARNNGGAGNWDFNTIFDNYGGGGYAGGPLTGDDFVNWSDRLRDIEEMVDDPALRNQVATARERARLFRQDFKRDLKKPDWAVVQLQVMKPLIEVRDRIADELARRENSDALVPIDRDPVPNRYSDLVRRYYEELGKDK